MSIRKRSRDLRKRQTPAEKQLWDRLRSRRLDGYKFLRQHPIVCQEEQGSPLYFILDFYCNQEKLAIEVDGEYHENSEQQHYDSERDKLLNDRGIKVIRISNEEIKEIDNVIERIRKELCSG